MYAIEKGIPYPTKPPQYAIEKGIPMPEPRDPVRMRKVPARVMAVHLRTERMLSLARYMDNLRRQLEA